jgi:hypothetical protein
MFTIDHAQCSTVSSAWVCNTERTLSILIWNSTPCSTVSPASSGTSERIMKTNHGEGLQMCTGVHIKCLVVLSNFNQTWILLTDFSKNPQTKISWKLAQQNLSCSLWTDIQISQN